MLDLTKLLPQFDGISADLLREDIQAAVQRAEGVLHDASVHADDFESKLAASQGYTFWPLATLLEPVDLAQQVQPVVGDITVAAVDGSQIMPSHHEVYNCYLINLGRVVISYAEHQQPVLLESVPHLYHAVEDLYPLIDRRRLYVDEQFVALERSLLELSTLRDLSLQAKERSLPVVALVDGSLIQWALDQMPQPYQRSYIDRLGAIHESFYAGAIPLIGYISHSRSFDIINLLRTRQCPYEVSHCQNFCSELSEEDFPCSTIWPVTDRQLFGNVLPRNSRGPLFLPGAAKAAVLPARHQITACYMNVDAETARLEFPRWLTQKPDLLSFALGAVLGQCVKGNGYPISLAEAHNLAVVRTSERRQFFGLIAQHLMALGIQSVRVSPKESGKRTGII
jgi:hypothetical protein